MKKITLLFLLFFFGVIYSCKKDNYGAPPFDPNTAVSFNKDVLPIFTASCTDSKCHGGAINPDLTPANAYDNLTGLGDVDPGKPDGSKLYILLTSSGTNKMPPSGNLPIAKLNIIKAWILQGAEPN